MQSSFSKEFDPAIAARKKAEENKMTRKTKQNGEVKETKNNESKWQEDHVTR